MPNGILSPDDFTIAPGSMRSLQDRLLELRRGLPDILQGSQPGGQPQQTQQEQANQSLGDKINQVAQSVAQQGSQLQAQETGQQPSKSTARKELEEYQKYLNQGLNPFAPKESIGPDTIGKMIHGRSMGGIFGTGVQPLDVLAFAIGNYIASRAPRSQAHKIAMDITMLPSQFRASQEKSGQEFLQQKLAGIQADVGLTNAETAQLKNAQAQKQYEASLGVADLLRKGGKEAEALAFEADRVNDFMKLMGGQAPENLPPHLADELDIIANGGPISPILRQRGIDSPEKARQLLGRMMSRQRPVVSETGEVLVGTPEGFFPREQVLRQQQAQTQPQQIPTPKAAPSVTTPPVTAQAIPPAAPQVSGFVPPDHKPGAATNADASEVFATMKPEDQLKAQIAASQLERETGLRVGKKLDVGTKTKLLAQRSLLKYSEDLANSYEKAVKAYGGDEKFGFWLRQKLSAIQGLPGAGGGGGSTFDTLMSLGARFMAGGIEHFFGKDIKPEARELLVKYSNLQRFARGVMQDTGNLALNERARAEQMFGTLNMSPEFVRDSLKTIYKITADDYNDMLRLNIHSLPEGIEPISPELKTFTPKNPHPGWERIEVPAPRIQGAY